ncbi:hypothetical protein [Duganella fentianensis]|uniref:hypothetical protein n=1 Tax=Duganella fentianensis TaxID=2692177 RepID=UPI0032B203A2
MLITDAKAALERLLLAQDAQANVEEVRSLIDLHKSLVDKQLKLHAVAARSSMLRKAGVPLSDRLDFHSARKLIAQLLDRFNARPKASTLTQGKHLSGLFEALEAAIATLEITLRRDWSQYFAGQLFAGLPPERRRIGLAQTPDNKIALDTYTRSYEKFARYRNTVPASKEVIDEVHALSQELGRITFEENLPESVEAFVNSINNGASLRLLTPEVLDWLSKQDLLDSYVVRARV